MSDFENDFAPLFMRGLAMIAEGEYEEAISLFDRVIEMEPVFAEAYSQRGFAKLRLYHKEEAMEDLNMALEISPHLVEAFVFRARLHASNANYRDAAADLDQAVGIEPDDINALMIRGFMNYDIDRYAQAIEDYDRVIELYPDFAEAYDRRAAAKQTIGKPEEALADIDKMIELEPDSPDAWAQRIVILNTLRRYDEVLENLAVMPRIFDSEETQYSLQNICLAKGQTLLALGRNEEAIVAFAETPDYANVWQVIYGTAVAQGRLGQMKKCRKSLEDVKRLADEAEDKVKAKYFSMLLEDWSDEKAATLPAFEMMRSNMTFFAGEAAYEADDCEEALRLYNETLAMNPMWVKAYFNKGMTQRILGELDAALETADKALALDPDEERVIHFKGTLLFDMDRNDESEEIFSRLIEMDPEYPHYYHNRAKARFEKENWQEAIDDLTRALELLENDAGFLRLRAFCYWALEQPGKALEDFSRILYFDPENVDAMYHRANLYRILERYEEAIVAADKVLDRGEEDFYHAEARLIRGRIWGELAIDVGTARDEGRTIPVTNPELSNNAHYTQRECFDHAAEDFNEAVRLMPDNVEARWFRGFYFYKDREYLAALDDLQFVERESPEMSSVYYYLGWCYYELGDAAKSLAAFDKANEFESDASNYYGRSITLEMEWKLTEAEASYRQGLELEPENAWLTHHLGHSLNNQGYYQAAEEWFVKSMTLHDSIEWFSCLADNLILQGKLDEAAELLRTAIEKDPIQAGAYFQLGRVYEMQGKPDRAKDMFLLAVRSEDPAQRSYRETEYINLYGRARAMTHLGRYEEALERFYQYLWEVNCTVRGHCCNFYMAKSLEALGRNQEALEQYRLALQYMEAHHELEADIQFCRERIAALS